MIYITVPCSLYGTVFIVMIQFKVQNVEIILVFVKYIVNLSVFIISKLR